MKPKSPLLKSITIAFRGAVEASRSERNIRIQWVCVMLLLGAGWVFRLTLMEWVCVTICVGIVLAAEMMNTAVEVLVDLLEPNICEEARRAKDFAAGSVFITALTALTVAVLIFGNHILH